MVDFQNPAVIEKDFLAVVKLWHLVDGIFLWEFFITLDYEWSIIRGHRPYRWTIWIYSLARVCTLISVILNMLAFDSSTPINCQLWVIFELIFASLAFAAASILIVLRIIAIWNGNRIAVAIAICAWNANVAFLIHNITRLHAAWVPTQSVCVVLNTESTRKNVTATLVTDVVLLLTMLVGLLRMRLHGNSMFGLAEILWRQGLIWLFLATVAEVTPAVFIGLNLNGPFNLMFQTPALIGMSIAATRMYRSLTDFTSPESFDSYLSVTGHTANAHPKRIFSAPVAVSRVEVAVHTSSEGYPPTMTDQRTSYGSYSADSRSQDKRLELGIGSDLENGIERG
jgi:hypothetical protein